MIHFINTATFTRPIPIRMGGGGGSDGGKQNRLVFSIVIYVSFLSGERHLSSYKHPGVRYVTPPLCIPRSTTVCI
jgi:hypothetical protein